MPVSTKSSVTEASYKGFDLFVNKRDSSEVIIWKGNELVGTFDGTIAEAKRHIDSQRSRKVSKCCGKQKRCTKTQRSAVQRRR